MTPKKNLKKNTTNVVSDKSSTTDYKKNEGHTINHFYEKLLLLRERMNTKTGKQIADGRHQFMQSFLEQFYREWDGIA